MSTPKSNLRLMGAFAALALLALAVGCRGFFVKPTLTSITISPTAPQVALGQTTNLQLWARLTTVRGARFTLAFPGPVPRKTL